MLSLAVYGSIVAAERRSASAAERQAVERLALDTADTCPWNGTEVAADEAGEEMHLTDDDQQFCVRAGSAHIDTTCSSCSMDTTSRRRLRLRNRPVARERGCGSFQRVYDMGGHEVCVVRTDAALAEVQATVARILDLRGSLAQTVRLRRYSATASSSSEGTRDWQFVLDPSMRHKDDLAFHLTSLCVVCSLSRPPM